MINAFNILFEYASQSPNSLYKYFSRKTNKVELFHLQIMQGCRELQQRCNCALSLKDNVDFACKFVSDEDREKIHQQFWELLWGKKKTFVTNSVCKVSFQFIKNVLTDIRMCF